jgi:XTP/dITP diphosphohydrolase
MLGGLGYQLVTLAEQGIAEVATESGNSYEQNAQLKATAYAKLSQLITLADDSGLEVDALGGKPGIHSARFAASGSMDRRAVMPAAPARRGRRPRRRGAPRPRDR